MTSWCFVGDFDHPISLLRDPKWLSVGVSEIHTHGRRVFPRRSLGLSAVERLLDA